MHIKLKQVIADRYKIENLIGRGGMGDVYRAEDLQTHQMVAIKVLKEEFVANDPDLLERFAREGQALRKLNHPNIVQILDTIEKNHCIVMEYVVGGSLRDLLETQKFLSVERIMEIALDLADALTRAHRLKIIHRDIKPDNVLLAEDGTPRLTDFGVAAFGDRSHITATGALVGTFTYLSPEACRGEVLDERTDIWSFGVLLYELLTRHNPFKRDQPVATISAIANDDVLPIGKYRDDILEELEILILRMLEKDKDKRIPSVRQVGAELEAIIRGLDAPLHFVPEAMTKISPDPSESRFATPTDEKTTQAEISELPTTDIKSQLALVAKKGLDKASAWLDKIPEPTSLDSSNSETEISEISGTFVNENVSPKESEKATTSQSSDERKTDVNIFGIVKVIEEYDGSTDVRFGPFHFVEDAKGEVSIDIESFTPENQFWVNDDNKKQKHKHKTEIKIPIIFQLGCLLLLLFMCIMLCSPCMAFFNLFS